MYRASLSCFRTENREDKRLLVVRLLFVKSKTKTFEPGARYENTVGFSILTLFKGLFSQRGLARRAWGIVGVAHISVKF